MTTLATISPRAVSAPESGIVEVVNYARGRDGLIPLWVGEGDLPTPAFISDVARDAPQQRSQRDGDELRQHRRFA